MNLESNLIYICVAQGKKKKEKQGMHMLISV